MSIADDLCNEIVTTVNTFHQDGYDPHDNKPNKIIKDLIIKKIENWSFDDINELEKKVSEIRSDLETKIDFDNSIIAPILKAAWPAVFKEMKDIIIETYREIKKILRK